MNLPADLTLTPGARVKAAPPIPGLGSVTGWVHDIVATGAWVIWDTGHTWLMTLAEIQPIPFTVDEREEFLWSENLVWENCDYFTFGWDRTRFPMINPASVLCKHPNRCPAHHDDLSHYGRT